MGLDGEMASMGPSPTMLSSIEFRFVTVVLVAWGTVIGEGLLRAAESPPNEITEHYTRMLRYHQRMDGHVPDQSVVFLGDSLTQGLCTDAVAQPSVNYGIGSDTTVGVLGRLTAYSNSLGRASAVVLAIGVNDLLFRDNREIAENYRRILERLPAGTPVVCSALLPINELTYARGTPVSNARIVDLNGLLRDLCANFPRCVYVNARPQLVDGDGNLKASFEDGDGIHLNAAGNRVWSDALRAGLQKARRSAVSSPRKRRKNPVILALRSSGNQFTR
jgi:lysophospholipase L1-like esterase